ncbi:MAG: HEAT repeat domain-containing protein [Bacteroidota bacterium]
MTHVQDRLAEYLSDDLGRRERAEIDAHLQGCTLCREEFDTLLRLWSKLGALPEEEPSERVRARFHSMLEAYQEGLRHAPATSGLFAVVNRFVEKFWPVQPAAQVGIAGLLLVFGVFAGTRFPSAADDHSEITQLRGEIRHMGQLLAVSLLSQQSASERLRGVASTYQMDQPDEQVVSALLRALKFDSNVNVRLAAIDALGKFVSDPAVGREVIATLPRESSPLVQIALIDVLIQEKVRQSADVLRSMAADPSVDNAVKQKIASGLKELSL